MNSIRDLLQSRRTEILRELEPLEATTNTLRTQLAAAESKMRTLAQEAVDIEKAMIAIGKREKMENTVTIKDAILQVLRDHPGGMSSGDLLAQINRRFFDGTVVRTSMSPQLSRLLNKDKKIKARGDLYFLA